MDDETISGLFGFFIGVCLASLICMAVFYNVGVNAMRKIAVEQGHAHWKITSASGDTEFEWNPIQKVENDKR